MPPDEVPTQRPRVKRLLASIHDVSPAFESAVDRLADQLSGILGGPRFAMLVVPDHWGVAPITPAFAARLRDWADAGVEMFLHGWRHRDETRHTGTLAALKARHMTAGEGEFLGLDADEAERRMLEGRDLIEQATGRGVAGFIAPAWLYGAGAHEAMARVGFALAEDHFRVWRPRSARIVARGPVVTWASRTPARLRSSLAVAAVARAIPAWLPTMRVAVHPGDVGESRLLNSIDRTVRALARERTVSRYADLDEREAA